MQDLPKLLPAEALVGFSEFERWFSFSPVKNSVDEAVKASEAGVYAASPGAGEAAVFEANARLLRLAGAAVEEGPKPSHTFLGLPLDLSPSIALTPNFALTVDELMRRVGGGDAISISARSSLVLDGDIEVHSLDLDGALAIRACRGASVAVRCGAVANAGWPLVGAEPGSEPPDVTIRGYVVDKSAGLEVVVDEPGEYELVGEGELRKLG